MTIEQTHTLQIITDIGLIDHLYSYFFCFSLPVMKTNSCWKYLFYLKFYTVLLHASKRKPFLYAKREWTLIEMADRVNNSLCVHNEIEQYFFQNTNENSLYQISTIEIKIGNDIWNNNKYQVSNGYMCRAQCDLVALWWSRCEIIVSLSRISEENVKYVNGNH